jgi:hypothetical protein
MPDDARASMANDRGSGRNTPESFASFDPDTSSWRTSQGYLFGDLDEFSATWPRSGSMRNGTAYRRRPLVPRISGKGCFYWPTPDASVANLGESIASWLTRRAREKAKHRNGNGFGMRLPIAVRIWPTPQAADAIRCEFSIETLLKTWEKAKGRERGAPHILPYCVAETDGGILNPTWVEWLMGFPIGWTAFEPSAMP